MCVVSVELEVSPVAVNVLFDALCESKNSLLPGPTCDERRAAMVDAETGGPDVTAFSIALIKARFLVIVSWFLFGKGNVVGILVIILKVLSDTVGGFDNIFATFKDNQELALVGLGSAGLMAQVGQAQEEQDALRFREAKERRDKADAEEAAKAEAQA